MVELVAVGTTQSQGSWLCVSSRSHTFNADSLRSRQDKRQRDMPQMYLFLQELKDLSRNKPRGVFLEPHNDNMLLWNCVLDGPSETPYEGGKFSMSLKIPHDYPLTPPEATFKTRIFHPNIHFKTGEVCLDILKTNWTPAWTILSVCQAILSMLSDPNADSPLNCDAGNLIRCNDTKGFDSLARMYTIDYAMQ
jgi:peroxin-4